MSKMIQKLLRMCDISVVDELPTTITTTTAVVVTTITLTTRTRKTAIATTIWRTSAAATSAEMLYKLHIQMLWYLCNCICYKCVCVWVCVSVCQCLCIKNEQRNWRLSRCYEYEYDDRKQDKHFKKHNIIHVLQTDMHTHTNTHALHSLILTLIAFCWGFQFFLVFYDFSLLSMHVFIIYVCKNIHFAYI